MRTFIRTLAINVAIFVFAIGFLELGAYGINNVLNVQNSWNTNLESDLDADRAIENLPDKSYSKLATKRSLEKIEIQYELDEFGRREDPGLDKTRDEYLILLGDSNIYGEGVRAEETIASHLNRMQEKYSVYNYGIPGTAPHQFLKRFERRRIREEIPNRDGALVLLLYDFQVARANLKFSWLLSSSPNQVYYWLDEEGELQGGKSFRQTRPFFYYSYQLLAHSQLRQLISHFSPKIVQIDIYNDEELLLFAKLAERIHKLYQEQFHNERFYILYGGKPSKDRIDIKYLRERGIKVFLNFESDLIASEDTLLDFHYNEIGTKKVAKKIWEIIKAVED